MEIINTGEKLYRTCARKHLHRTCMRGARLKDARRYSLRAREDARRYVPRAQDICWNRSCLRVADKVTRSRSNGDKQIFLKICYMIPKLTNAVELVACFQALCGVQSLKEVTKKVGAQITQSEIELVDSQCNWSIAKNWAQWWSKYEHLTMLCKVFSSMDGEVWDRCPSTTNAVERKNKDCKTDNPSSFKLAMIKVYKLDKIAALRHIGAEENISLSYRSHSDDA